MQLLAVKKEIMDFTYEKILNAWKCKSRFLDKEVEFRLMGIDIRPDLTREKALEIILHRIKNGQDRIEDQIGSFSEAYNQEWAEPEEGFPKLSKEEFINKMLLYAVNYEVVDASNDAITLYYSDSGFLGGHSFEVTWLSNDEMWSNLVG